MTNQQALRKIKRHQPTSPDDFRALGLLGRFVGAGVFRETYRIRGTNLIVKFPLDEAPKDKPADYTCGRVHTRTEVKRIAKLSTIPVLRPHLPKVWYADLKHGVVVMTHYVKASGGYGGWNRIELLGRIIRKLVKLVAHTEMNDIHGDNVRLAGDKHSRRLVFVDLGY